MLIHIVFKQRYTDTCSEKWPNISFFYMEGKQCAKQNMIIVTGIADI